MQKLSLTKMQYKPSERGYDVGSTGDAATTEAVAESADELRAGSTPCPMQPACSRTRMVSPLPRPRLDSAAQLPTPEHRVWRRRIPQLLANVLHEQRAASARAARFEAGDPVRSRWSPRVRTAPAPPVIVLTYANDRSLDGRYLKNLPEECRANKAALEDAADANHVELVSLMNATLDEVIATCRKYRERIVGVHFAGHSDGESVLFERGDGIPTAATAGSFAEFLGELPALQWLFLNGCATRGQVGALRDRGVPVVLATSTLVRDEVAQTIAYYFYLGMGRGETIAAAFRHAAVDTRFKFSTDPRSSSAGLYRDLEGMAVPPEHAPWELHGDETATQYRLVPAVRAALDAPEDPWRPSDSGRFRRALRYQVVAGCLIALAIAAVVTVTARTVWSFIGKPEPAAPATHSYLHRDHMPTAARLATSLADRTAGPSRALAPSEQAATTQPHSERSATRHEQSQTPPARPSQPPKAATSPRSAQDSAPELPSAERDRLAPHAELLPRPTSLADLDRETVKRRIRSHRDELKSCYEQQLLSRPALRGTVNTRFLITPAGMVAALEVSGLDPDVSSCVADTIRNIEFPRSSSDVLVNYPFHFHPIGGDVE